MIWRSMNSIAILFIGIILQTISNSFGADPKFETSTKMRLVLVPADAAVGSVIYRLRATDEEFDYPLQFELVGDSSSSTVQIETLPCTKYNSVCQANVVLTRRLEPGRFYDFQVSVKDIKGGMETQSCSITATNYTTPHDTIFPHKTGIIMIPEDAKRGTELDYVIARKNPLFPKQVLLELWGSPLFAIRQKYISPENTEGTIFLLGPLDFETQSMYHLTVLANDAYAEPGQDSRNIAGLEVIVIVQDVQDVAPIFTMAPPVTRLPPELLPGDKILQVHAEDGDKGNPREIRYGLVSEGNPFTSFFDINDTSGEIFLVSPLDEISAITHIGDPVLLTIIAEEVKVQRDEPPAMASTVQLALFLPERSNTPPYFENDHYISRIDENAPQGTALVFSDPYVTRVYDDDTGKNGVFSLTLLDNNGTFEITPNVAEMRTVFLLHVRDNQYLDYEQRHSVQFQILAQELGPATNLSTNVSVTVFINDINDNPPVFENDMYTVELPENMTVGTKVVQVQATDVDTDIGGRIRYTQILGYLNTSLNLNAENGLITVSTDNHGFDREMLPEYHFYVEARDNDGTGNSAQIPLILKMIDVNDNAPIFEKSLYEFILTTDLRNFTNSAVIRATDLDAEEPNNVIRYEIINGNYENKFNLDKITGHLTLREPLMLRPQQQQQQQQQNQQQQQQQQRNIRNRRQISNLIDNDVFILTARAYDLGVPVLFSTTTIRIYPPESRVRTVTFVVPGQNPNRAKIEETLQLITGGRVLIHEIKPYTGNEIGATNIAGNSDDKSVVVATVLYDSNSVVDISQIQNKLSNNNKFNTTSAGIVQQGENAETVYKAENRLLFWLLIFLALLIALSILTLLLCCICSWCPLYAATRKRVIRVNSTEDDVHLVHREMGVGKQTKSVQVAEWMGRREAWSAEKSSDSRTKPTQWEFSRRVNNRQKLENNINTDDNNIEKHIESAEDNKQQTKTRNNLTEIDHTIKDTQFHNSRTNLINNDREVYIEDVNEEENTTTNIKNNYTKQNKMIKKQHNIDERQIDDDSMRRHEIDRGSDYEEYDGRPYNKRQIIHEDDNVNNRDQLYIKDGNAEILRLITRGKNDEDNIYVNVPQQQHLQQAGPSQPHYIMVDNTGGKEILMKRYIEEQANGKHIIREHYVVPGTTKYIQHNVPNEIHVQHPQQHQHQQQHISEVYITKSQPESIIYSHIDPEQIDPKLLHVQNERSPHQMQQQQLQQHQQRNNVTEIEIESQMKHGISSQSLIQQELENSLKQQNALLRQILLEKAKLEEKYSQQEVALETQSLPPGGHSLAIATQTDCDAGTQTDSFHNVKPKRRRARSENDDSMSENDYEYVRYSPPNSPEGVYWIKRKVHGGQRRRHRQRYGKYYRNGMERPPRRHVIRADDIKRNIRTPIKEESEENPNQSPSPPPQHKQRIRLIDSKQHSSSTTANMMMQKLKPNLGGGAIKRNKPLKSAALNKEVLMEISDSLDEQQQHSPDISERRKQLHKIHMKQYEYYPPENRNESDEDDTDTEIVIRRNVYRNKSGAPSRRHYAHGHRNPDNYYDHNDNDDDDNDDDYYVDDGYNKRYYIEDDDNDNINISDDEEIIHTKKYPNKKYLRHRSSMDYIKYDDDDYYYQHQHHSPSSDHKRNTHREDTAKLYISSKSVSSTPNRLSRKGRQSLEELDTIEKPRRRQTASEPPHRSIKGPAPKPPPPLPTTTTTTTTRTRTTSSTNIDVSTDNKNNQKSAIDKDNKKLSKSDIDLARKTSDEYGKSVPRYMEWYYNKGKDNELEKKRLDKSSAAGNKKMVGAIEKRIKAKAPRGDNKIHSEDVKSRTEPSQRPIATTTTTTTTETTISGAHLLKEDLQKNKILAPKIETDTNHPLLQYSEHRYEHEYDPVPDLPIPPTKLSHYMYPETPPLVNKESKQNKSSVHNNNIINNNKPKPSPIKENEIKDTKRSSNTKNNNNSKQSSASKQQLNASTLEDDHDSGIAMNSLLHNMSSRKNPITDKKSVFTIAYDDVKIKKIQSENDSPNFL